MANAARPAVGKDVALPGTTPASATSKPVIVGHTSQIADPMMNASQPSADTAASPTQPPSAAASTGSMKPKLTPSDEAQKAHAESDKTGSVSDEADVAEAKQEEDNQARLQDLIESGEYNVSIGQKTKKSGAGTFILTMLAIVLVGVIVLFILTDLKIIDLGIKLPFHIFKQ